MRAQVDAVGIGSGTLLADDPLLTPRHVYRERPLTRVVFDRRLRASPGARLLSTLEAGPVIILTSRHAQGRHPERADALERAGATVVALADPTMVEALRTLAARDIQSLVLEGGPALHQAAWDAGVVDFVQLYIAPVTLADPRAPSRPGLPVALGRDISVAALLESTTRMLGPDVLIEGYVHRPH
jgi:diaminohydroxyphosphoribosylaminopyrimidine deaminase/5-amino-6-(5-phosphoribosylamino)uracil reductase